MSEPLTDEELAESRESLDGSTWDDWDVRRLFATIDALTAERNRYWEELRQIKSGRTYHIVSNVAITGPEEK
jgi:O6-methylguanine-DNA--protein-cysteine methyltransferase